MRQFAVRISRRVPAKPRQMRKNLRGLSAVLSTRARDYLPRSPFLSRTTKTGMSWILLIFFFLAAFFQPGLRGQEFDLAFRSFPDGSQGRDVLVRSRDGLFIYGHLRKLIGDGPFPGVILVHGGLGGSARGTRGLVETPVARALLREGYALLSIDYRGGDWLTEYQDVVAGFEFFRELPYIQKDAVALIGGSHGGKIVLQAVTEIHPQAAIYCAGFPAPRVLYEHVQGEGASVFHAPAEKGRQRPGVIAVTELVGQLGGTPQQVPENWAKYNMLDRLDSVTTPLLLVHGREDAMSPFQATTRLAEKLGELGKSFETFFPDHGPHGFYWGLSAQPGGQEIYQTNEMEEFTSRSIRFLNSHLK